MIFSFWIMAMDYLWNWTLSAFILFISLDLYKSEECFSMRSNGLYQATSGLRYSFMTQDACLKVCLATSNCTAINYNEIETACYIIDVVDSPIYPSDCCRHYTKSTGPCAKQISHSSPGSIPHSSLVAKTDLQESKVTVNNQKETISAKFSIQNKRDLLGLNRTSNGPVFVVVNASNSKSVSDKSSADKENKLMGSTSNENVSSNQIQPETSTISDIEYKRNGTEEEIWTKKAVKNATDNNAGMKDKTEDPNKVTVPESSKRDPGVTKEKNSEDNESPPKYGMNPISFEAPCKSNATIMELVGRMNQQGGQDVGITMTSAECKDWCRRNKHCVTIDYNLWEHSCWWHWRLTPSRNNTCCTHHRKTQTCQYDCFDIYHGYILNASDTEFRKIHISRCRKECLISDNCTAYAYSNASATCWLYDLDITALSSDKEPQRGALFAQKKTCYGNSKDREIFIATTTQLPTLPEFTFPSIPSTLPPYIRGGESGTTDQTFVMSPSSVVVLAGCTLVLLVGIGTLIGFMFHRRREKRALEASFAHPVIWMNEYGNFSTRGPSYWFSDGRPCGDFSPGVAINPAFQADEFPMGRSSADFALTTLSGRRPHLANGSRVLRTRSYSEGFMEPSPSLYPTFPLRPLRVSVPSNTSAPSPVLTPSTNAHNLPSGYTTFSSSPHIHPDGRRLPRYEISRAVNPLDDDQNTFRCAYP